MENLNNVYNEIVEVSDLLYRKGWAEKNAGNFSIRVDFDIDFEEQSEFPLPENYPELSGLMFVVSGKGIRMRNIAVNPKEGTVIIKISNTGDSFFVQKGKCTDPTSELATHLAIHQMIKKRHSDERVVLHSHVTELIALTHINKFCDQQSLSNLLWKMHPEATLFLPKGVGFVPFYKPGTVQIAHKTVSALIDHDIVLWEKHGAFSVSDSLNNAFDLIEITAKLAKIYFMISGNNENNIGLSSEQLKQIRDI